jgi:hypothetical protein
MFGIGLLCVAAAGCAQMPMKPPAMPPKAQAPSPPASAPAGPAPAAASAVRVSAPARPAAPPPPPAAAPALDLASLKQRLRDTKAIGVFTKLSLKNQVDDLLGQFRDFYSKKDTVTLEQLRQQYDLLLLKVLSVLQDGDPALAARIAASREAIWGILADPVRFSKLQT